MCRNSKLDDLVSHVLVYHEYIESSYFSWIRRKSEKWKLIIRFGFGPSIIACKSEAFQHGIDKANQNRKVTKKTPQGKGNGKTKFLDVSF